MRKRNLFIICAALVLSFGTYIGATTYNAPLIVSGLFTASGHTVIEGVTSTGATGSGKMVYDGSPALTTPTGIVAGSTLEYQYRNGTVFGAVTNTGPVPTASWTLRNSAIISNFDGHDMGVYITPNGSVNFRLATQALSAPPYTVIAKLDCRFINQATLNTAVTAAIPAQVCGIFLYDGTKIEDIELLENVTAPQLAVRQSSSVTSGGSLVAGATANLVPSSSFVIKIVDNSTNRIFYYYTNGGFTSFFSEASAAFLTPTSVGPGGLDTGAGVGATNTQIEHMAMSLSYWCVSAATTCNGL
jgi:hypothetical protein